MVLDKEPFTKYNLGEDSGTTFTVRLNIKERQWLNELKKTLDIKSDSKALKLGAYVGLNVLHNTLGKDLLRYLFKKERSRLSDFENF